MTAGSRVESTVVTSVGKTAGKKVVSRADWKAASTAASSVGTTGRPMVEKKAEHWAELTAVRTVDMRVVSKAPQWAAC